MFNLKLGLEKSLVTKNLQPMKTAPCIKWPIANPLGLLKNISFFHHIQNDLFYATSMINGRELRRDSTL